VVEMMSENHFQYAVSSARPRGGRMIEAYSPKRGRGLQCFDEHVFEQWISLEVDLTIGDPRFAHHSVRPAHAHAVIGLRV